MGGRTFRVAADAAACRPKEQVRTIVRGCLARIHAAVALLARSLVRVVVAVAVQRLCVQLGATAAARFRAALPEVFAKH